MTQDTNDKNPFDLSAGVPSIEGEVRPKPKFADRISTRVVFLLIGLLAAIVVIFFASLDAMEARQKERKEKRDQQAVVATKATETVAPKDLTDAGDPINKQRTGSSLITPQSDGASDLQDLTGGSGRASLTAGNAPLTTGGQAGPSGVPALSAPGQRGGLPPDGGLDAGNMRADSGGSPPIKVLTPEQQAANTAKMERIKRMEQARQTGMVAAVYTVDDKKPAGLAAGLPANASALLAGLTGQGGSGMPSGGAQLMPASAQRSADSEQDQKLQFLKNAGKDSTNYLPHTPMAAVSPNEVKRGAYIPLRLEVAINSDQPGMINARVTEDVYDTTTGCRLLIPAMTLVQGVYDSMVAVGQTRNLAVWNYMRFEDGSDLNLGGMQGYDSSGAAGIAADVDNHYFKLFGLAFGMSVITAGVQQSVSPPPANSNGMSTQQSISTALAQQYGQLGAQIIGKHMQVQPTLRNYPGERFIIMTPSTIVFQKVWRKRC